MQFGKHESYGNEYVDLACSDADSSDEDMPALVESQHNVFVRTSHDGDDNAASDTPAASLPSSSDNSPLETFAEPIPKAIRVVDLTARDEPPRIDLLRRIHLQEMRDGFVLDPSWCACPNCGYNKGDLRTQRFTTMKRLYQLNTAIYGPQVNMHVTEYELLKTLI